MLELVDTVLLSEMLLFVLRLKSLAKGKKMYYLFANNLII